MVQRVIETESGFIKLAHIISSILNYSGLCPSVSM